MASTRQETDSLGVVDVPADKLWRAQSRALRSFAALPLVAARIKAVTASTPSVFARLIEAPA